MKQKLFSMFALLLMAATGAMAQTTINVTAGDLGKAVCTDGSIYENVYKAQSAGKTAAAKIICLDTQNSKALALSLDNQAVAPGTVDYATAQSRCEALNTTLAVTFGTWVLPSKAQWEAMIEAAGGYKKLRDGIGTLFGGTKMEAVVYWSSTAGTTGHWRFHFNDGDWEDDTYNSSARACLVINLPQTYSVTLAEGTEDTDKWTVKVGEGEAQAFPVEGLNGSETVTATYSGTKKVKSVKAVKKASGNAYLKWDANQNKLVATEIPTTAIKVTNSNEDVLWEGTYVVEDDVTIKGNIRLSGNVDLIIKDGATLTANKIQGVTNNLSIYGQANQTGQLVVNSSTDDAITGITTLEVHSAKVSATSSGSNRGGFFYIIKAFNVYGGLVDATGADGYGISLNGSMNIYGGEVKAVGNGTHTKSYGIMAESPSTVTVNGGKLWAENADEKALRNITLTKGTGFTGKIEYSSDKSTWSETVDANAKYVRVGYY